MIYLPTVTLITIACIKREESLKSLIYSCKNIKFGAVKMISDYKLNFIPKYIEYIKCDTLDYNGFSNFAFYELWKYINTEHCLFVHHDGFVVNSELWSYDFLKYDYIGAPWQFNPHNPHLNLVGNGGFSLRSKKILKLPTEKNIKLISTFDMPFPVEDMNYCNYNKEHFIKSNIKYAPVNIAANFSTEINIPNISVNSFGFHNFSYNLKYINLLNEININDIC